MGKTRDLFKKIRDTKETFHASSVQSLSRVQLFVTPWTAVHQASLSITNSMSIESVMPSNHLILSSLSPPALNLSQHQGFFWWVGSSHRWPNFWNFSFNISPSNEYSGLISLRIDWFNRLAVQGTLKSLLQPHSSKASWFIPNLFPPSAFLCWVDLASYLSLSKILKVW